MIGTSFWTSQLSALDPERMRGRDDIDTMDVTT
jgi:hypothetical protein